MAKTTHTLYVNDPEDAGDPLRVTVEHHEDGTGNECAFVKISLISPGAFKEEPIQALRRLGYDIGKAFIRLMGTKVDQSPPDKTPSTQPDTPGELLAAKLIDAWCAEHGGKISWRRCIEIIAIVLKQPQEDVDRLLALGLADDGRCEMCGQPSPVEPTDAMLDAAAMTVRLAKRCGDVPHPLITRDEARRVYIAMVGAKP